MNPFVTLLYAPVNVQRRILILGLPVLRRMSSCALIYDGIDDEFIPTTPPEQQFHQANAENSSLTV